MHYLFDGVSLQNGRRSNMDSLLLKPGKIGGKDALLAVVCDGVGSLADGAFASGAAVQLLGEWFAGAEMSGRIGLRMRDAVLRINAHILAEAGERRLETATTLSALLLVEGDYYLVHVGDSRIYSYEAGELSALTSDDVSDTGGLTACLGHGEDIFLQYAEGRAEGKTFLICSDGLYNRMDMELMTGTMRGWRRNAGKGPIEALTRYVIGRGESDNISLALIGCPG